MSENNNNNNNNAIIMEKEINLTAHNTKHKITVRMDFANVPKAQMLSWAFADRIIAMQRALRECTKESLEEFVNEGYAVHALSAGTKPRSKAEVIAEAKAVINTLDEEAKAELLEALMG
jgi:hypothetical protein